MLGDVLVGDDEVRGVLDRHPELAGVRGDVSGRNGQGIDRGGQRAGGVIIRDRAESHRVVERRSDRVQRGPTAVRRSRRQARGPER